MAHPLVKPLNALLSAGSFVQSSITRQAVIAGMPPALSVEMTNHCNLDCPECINGSGQMRRKKGFIDQDLFDKIIKEVKPFLSILYLNFQGESMLHPGFFTILRKCRGINTALSTNGHYLSHENSERIAGSGLKKLIISLDGMDQETYSRYRISGSFEAVTEGIRNISEARRKLNPSMKLEIQFLVNRHNEHQIGMVRHFARQMNARVRLKSMQIINSGHFEEWLPSIKKFSRYEDRNGKFEIKSRFPDHCLRAWMNPVITWDGKVLPCCFDKDSEYIMGDLTDESMREIWNGPRYRIFRKSILTGRRMIDICRNCTSGLNGVIY